MPEDKKDKPVISVSDYFKNMGIDPQINKNSFTREEAAKVFELAAKELREKSELNTKIKAYIGYAWNVLQVVIKLV
jgi:BMFP domain-containing protein YqiC